LNKIEEILDRVAKEQELFVKEMKELRIGKIICLIFFFMVHLNIYAQGKDELQDADFNQDILKESDKQVIKDKKFISTSRINNNDYELFNRVRINYNSFNLGIMNKKEEQGYKLYKYYINYNSRNLKIYIGNYLAYFGQGLIIHPPVYYSKKTDPISSLIRKEKSLQPDLSTFYDDNPYFFGLAISYNVFRNIRLCFILSEHKLDASLNKDGTTRTIYLDTDELKNKNTLKEDLYGVRTYYSKNNIKLGSSYYSAKYSPRISPREEFKLRGDKNELLGMDVDYSLGRLRFLCEYAQAKNYYTADAKIASVIVNLNKLKLAYSIRDYGKNFHNIHGFVFSESPEKNPHNEIANYLGIEYKPKKSLNILTYYDKIKKFPIKYNKLTKIDTVGVGVETNINKNKISCYSMYKRRVATVKLIVDKKRKDADININTVKFELNYKIDKKKFRAAFYYKFLYQWLLNETEDGILYGFRISYLLNILNKVIVIKIGSSWIKMEPSKLVNYYPYQPKLGVYEDEVYGGRFYSYEKDVSCFYSLITTSFRKFNIASKYRYENTNKHTLSLQLDIHI